MPRLINQCPKCGGIANHTTTDLEGRSYYQCNTGLTTLGDVEGELAMGATHIVSCNTLIDQLGQVFSGVIAYVCGNKVRTVRVADGKVS